jgi:4-hydroxy-2-oxoheptanedioate aldolase
MTGSELREALRAGRRVYGTAILSTSPKWPGAVQGSGADFVFIDTEHTPIDRACLSWMCQTYRHCGLAPVVRIPSPDPYQACQALDGGACGVVAPYVESPEQVRRLVGAAKLRPLKGERLADALADHSTLGEPLAGYLGTFNAQSVLIVNIESVPAIDALDDICAVEGLDAVLVGPHDLSVSLGIPEQYRAAPFDAAVKQIIRTARRHGLGAGVHFWLGIDLEIEWARAGANLMLHSSDLFILGQTLRRDLDEMRRALGDLPATPGDAETAIV